MSKNIIKYGFYIAAIVGALWLIVSSLVRLANTPANYDVPREVCGIVKSKNSPLENRFSGTEAIFGSGSITKSQSVYYLYLEDGVRLEVSDSRYANTEVGDKACKHE